MYSSKAMNDFSTIAREAHSGNVADLFGFVKNFLAKFRIWQYKFYELAGSSNIGYGARDSSARGTANYDSFTKVIGDINTTNIEYFIDYGQLIRTFRRSSAGSAQEISSGALIPVSGLIPESIFFLFAGLCNIVIKIYEVIQYLNANKERCISYANNIASVIKSAEYFVAPRE